MLYNFQPVSVGATNITLGTPAGFSTPAQYQQITATVSAPQITVGNVTTGNNLETQLSISLPVAPPNPVTVTVTSNGPAIATVSNSATVAGVTTLTFTNVTDYQCRDHLCAGSECELDHDYRVRAGLFQRERHGYRRSIGLRLRLWEFHD